jgi:hypothetical protein
MLVLESNDPIRDNQPLFIETKIMCPKSMYFTFQLRAECKMLCYLQGWLLGLGF